MSKPVTRDDIRRFLSYVKNHEDDYDSFNVAQVQTVLGTLLLYLDAEDDKEDV